MQETVLVCLEIVWIFCRIYQVHTFIRLFPWFLPQENVVGIKLGGMHVIISGANWCLLQESIAVIKPTDV